MDENSNTNNEEVCEKMLKQETSSIIIAAKQKEQQISEQSSNTNPLDNQFDLPSFKCTECSYQSIWKHAVKRHQRIHFKEGQHQGNNKKNKFECDHCSYTIDSWEEFIDHQSLHITSDETSQDRLQCGKAPAGKSEIANKRFNKRNLYKCGKCQFESKYEKSFENHKKVHKSKNKSEVFECDQCNYNSDMEELFLKHIRILHEKGKPSVNVVAEVRKSGINCKAILGKLETSQTIPKRPYRRGKYADVRVKTIKNGLFECEHCSYQTAIRTALVKHQTNHLKN